MKNLKLVIMAAFLCLFLPMNIFADDTQTKEKRTVRVGYTDYYNFIRPEGQDKYKGYGVDYLNEISEYTNWEYQYIYYGWDTALEKLNNNEIDIMCNATKSAENIKKYEFSQYPIGIEQFVLYCLPETDLYYDDFESLEGRTIGLLVNSANTHSFDIYANKNQFSYNKKEFFTDDELTKALYNREVDAIATVHIAPNDDLKLIARYGSNPIYAITSKGSSIYTELNSAISLIKAESPQFDGDLYEKHYGKSISATQAMFTRQEVEFIEDNPRIRVGIWSDRIPMSYIDQVTLKPKGINKAHMDEISRTSGISFEYIPVSLGTALVDTLNEGSTDIICGVPNVGNYFASNKMTVSRPYHTSNLMFIGNSLKMNFNSSLKIATLKTTKAITAHIQQKYPSFEIIYANTIYECFEMVKKGVADIAFCNEYSAIYYLKKPAFSKLYALTSHSIDEPSVVVALEATNPLLMSIINKSITVIDQNKMDKMVIEQVANASYERTLADALYQYAIPLIILGVAAISWVYLIIMVSLGRKKNSAALKKINAELSLQQKRYEMVLSQTNDIIFEWNYQTKEIIYSKNFSEYLGKNPDCKNFPHNLEIKRNVHPDEYKECMDMYLSYDNGALCTVGEYRIKSKSGSYRWFRSRSTAVLNDEGEVVKVLGMLSDIHSEKRKLMAIENQAKKDDLTGIYNRSAAEELIDSYIENDVPGALFIIDVDNFKRINDTYGHQTGDEVLESVAKVLVKLFRGGDVVARLGGDEFMVFMADVLENYDVGDKARELVRNIEQIQGGDTKVSVSVGVASYPQDGIEFATLYKKADTALYRAKKNGKNQYAPWEV